MMLAQEVHYNQHGLLLLEGQGIYRLGDEWYAPDATDPPPKAAASIVSSFIDSITHSDAPVVQFLVSNTKIDICLLA